MFLESIRVLDVNICVQQPGKFSAHTRASADLAEVMPYLNAMFRRADYNAEANTIRFYHNKIEFTLVDSRINVAKFANRTELHELLDWIQELINDIYESRSDLTPLYEKKKEVPVLSIFALLPKTNCRACGEKSCMAFAAKLNKTEADIEECPVLDEPENQEKKQRLEAALG